MDRDGRTFFLLGLAFLGCCDWRRPQLPSQGRRQGWAETAGAAHVLARNSPVCLHSFGTINPERNRS